MKPEFVKYLQQDSILIVEGETKKKVLDAIVAHACTRCTMEEDQIRDAIWKRERMMTTGVGNGLALPHIRVGNIAEPVIVLGVCGEPVNDYNTQDDKPVKVVVFIIAADSDQEAYLQLLGSVSRGMRDTAFIDALFENAVRPTQILKLIQEHTKE